MPRKRRAIVWFRQDLRLHDNEALVDALDHAYEVIPVYIFDERVFKGKTEFGTPKTGPFRAKFILESVQDLQRSLKKLGSDLIVRIGKPEEELFKIAQQAKSSWIFCNRERTPDEVYVQDQLEKKLWSIGQELRYSRGKMLYHTGDLPFPIQHTPDTFSQFRKEVERYVQIREPLERPNRSFNFLTVDVDPGIMPGIEDFGWERFNPDTRLGTRVQGGESIALQRLKYFIWESEKIQQFEEYKDELDRGDFSTKLSAWLAQGCISPKLVYAEIKKYESFKGASASTNAIFLRLMYRDFLRFMVKKHGDAVFSPGGLRQMEAHDLLNDRDRFEQWQNGETGVPFIDANMRELNNTGYISHRGRLNVASYLIHEMKINWRLGADYFESVLIDYDVCSNWANWNNIAGVSKDPKEEKHLNPEAQAQRYDPQNQYVKFWLNDKNIGKYQPPLEPSAP